MELKEERSNKKWAVCIRFPQKNTLIFFNFKDDIIYIIYVLLNFEKVQF